MKPPDASSDVSHHREAMTTTFNGKMKGEGNNYGMSQCTQSLLFYLYMTSIRPDSASLRRMEGSCARSARRMASLCRISAFSLRDQRR